MFQRVHRIGEEALDPPTAEPSRIAVDETAIQIGHEQHWLYAAIDISWGSGLIIASVLSVVTFPWVLFSAKGGIYFFVINLYSVPLGPVFGILLADYWVFRAGDTSILDLYDKSRESKFWFVRGFSVAAVASVVIGAGTSLLMLQLSWMIGLPVGFISYVALRKLNLDERTTEYLSASPSPTAD